MTTFKWIKYYALLAKHISSWSKDPSRCIGAVAVGSKGQILSQGYNGFPRGIVDDLDRYDNRELKYKYVVHAEMNVIYNATYSGVSLDRSDLYIYGLPVCSECAKGIIQVGIKDVYICADVFDDTIWAKSWEQSKSMMLEAGLNLYWVNLLEDRCTKIT